jgi:hypothetical protein
MMDGHMLDSLGALTVEDAKAWLAALPMLGGEATE